MAASGDQLFGGNVSRVDEPWPCPPLVNVLIHEREYERHEHTRTGLGVTSAEFGNSGRLTFHN